jgi:tetratricopeptide (TPR) repeat protein
VGSNRIIISILFALHCFSSFGQSKEIEITTSVDEDNQIPVEDSLSLSDAYFKKGITLSLVYQNFTEGIKSFTLAINLNPDNALAYYNRGYAYMKTKQFEKAIPDLEKSLEMQPENYRAYLNLGKCYTDLREYELALHTYLTGTEYNNKYAPLHFNSGIAYHKSGQFEYAMNAYNKAIELDDTKAKYFFNRGLAKQEMLNATAGIEDLQKASEMEPENKTIHYAIGFSYLNIGLADNALESFSRVIEIDSTFWRAYFNRSLVNMELLDFESAVKDLRVYTDHNPDDPLGFFYAGKSEMELGKFYQALTDFEKAVKLDPDFGWANYYLGYVMINSFGKFEGCEYLEKALANGIDEARRTLDIACVNK